MPDDDQKQKVRHARDSGGEPIEAGVARQLSELAREMQAEPDMAELLQLITHSAVAEVDGADFVGISLIEGKKISTQAATDDLVARIDRLQYDLGDGPCLRSLREEMTVRSNDLSSDERWPRFASHVIELGVHSMRGIQLFVEGDNLGALNLFAGKPGAFTEHDESVAMLLASHAAIAMKGSAVETHLRTAVESRDLIGQAKGILMERYKISAIEAFNLLVLSSQKMNVKLRDIADTVANTGALPTERDRSN